MSDGTGERLGGALGQVHLNAEPLADCDGVGLGRRTGRRRAASVWFAVAASVVVLVSVGVLIVVNVAPHRVDVSSTASGGAARRNCSVERLPVLSDRTGSLVMGMDPSGRYIVGRTMHPNSSSRLDLLIWEYGELHRAELLGENQVPTDVNTSGVVVGTTAIRSASGRIDLQAWVYRDGAAALLPGARSVDARAISDGGVVVGTEDRRPVVWRSTSNKPSTLPLPAGAWEGTATDITGDGKTILGTLHRPQSGLNRPFVWSGDGTPRALPMPVVDGTTAVGAYALTIGGDWVAGTVALEKGRDDVPVRWNLRTGDVQVFPEFRTAGSNISADGWMTARDEHGRATLLLSERATLVLPRLPERTNNLPDAAKVISQDGLRVAGNASSAAAGGSLPVIWRCA